MERNTISEMHQILEAIEQGKHIQAQTVNTDRPDEWDNNTSKTPNFFSFRYRIKPEEPKKCYRPFDGITEFHDAIDRHGTWVINTNNHQHCQVIAFNKSGAVIGQSPKIYMDLLESYTFVDGTPCGVEEG